ncbi:hypothetical protein PORCRE_2124 [Porphyromonas crevioricanis JCM 15906]|uniref:Uncharacterized protein n=1 Tax=Porphyromonas crevioricanis JCM 15906 TaxID=1305617 RepID=T1CJB9_9PORP|nr:hypothetical protein PORCRE_2124 [Porphyromonas crevioricanis JCM 15906]GAD07015.1 hypothetical protein PORCAN_628 [Porphyromonas crevioricanis JCM 13913]
MSSSDFSLSVKNCRAKVSLGGGAKYHSLVGGKRYYLLE